MRSRTIFWILIATLVAATDGKAGDKCPSDAQTCLNYLVQVGKAGWAGIEGETTELGYEITQVVAGAPAEQAGLRVGDVLTKLNGASKGDADFEQIYREAMKPGNTVTFTFLRGDDTKEVRVKLIPMPKDVLALMVGRHMLEHAETRPSSNH